MRIKIGYPDEAEENGILERFRLSDPLPDLQAVSNAEEIIALVAERKQIRVEVSVQNYIVQVARATRKHPEIELGASPLRYPGPLPGFPILGGNQGAVVCTAR